MPIMQRFVSFKSSRFDSKTVKPHFINPDTGFGEDVVRWLIENVRHPAVVLDQPVQEDYGWGMWASANRAVYWISVAIDADSIGHDEAQWLMSIEAVRGCNPFRRLPPTHVADLLILCHALDTTLQSDPTVSNIRWWQEGFEVGQPSAHPQ
jgi:hypothetical protein